MKRFSELNLFKISLLLSQCLDFSILKINIAVAIWKTDISMTFSSLLRKSEGDVALTHVELLLWDLQGSCI